MEKLVLLIIGVLSSTTIMAQDCPAPEGFGTCVTSCTDNSNCTNGQICCSNGCGYSCMTPVNDPCATVRCAAPSCHELSPGTITPEGECCPVCACSASDGSMVAAGTSFMNDCNTCNCGTNGLAFCTLIACLPTTEPTTSTPTTTTTTTTDDTTTTSSSTAPPTDSAPTTDGTTVTPSVGPTDPTCPVGGQIRVGCASPCSITCANADTVLICPTVCVTNGCQCPRDTVIDEQSNTCVPRSDCPSSNTGQTCPAVQRTNEENCVNECSSNDDCQYERICCSNGCGGRVCSDSVEMCQLIQCAWPICEDGAQPAFSPFSCCPFCPTNTTTPPRPSGCTASDGTSVDVGETYMDQCNTCRCLEGGVGACTRRACIGCTLADGSWVAIGDTYKKDCNTCTCTDRDVDICTEIACNPGDQGCTLADGSWVAIGDTYQKDCNTCICTDRDVNICTEKACNPGDQDTLDGAGATVFAGLITTLLCGLLSVLS